MPINYKTYFSPTNNKTGIPRRTRHRICQNQLHNLEAPSISSPTSVAVEYREEENEVLDSQLQIDDVNLSPDFSDSEDDISPTSSNEFSTKPLYNGARITAMESSLMIFGLGLRHKLNKSVIGDILTLINFHLPKGESIPGSVYLQEKRIGTNYEAATKVAYCGNCESIITDNEKECTNCNDIVDKRSAIREGNFFISFDIASSIRNVLQLESVQESIDTALKDRSQEIPKSYSSIMDGDMYRSLNLAKEDLTCCVNTDGVAVFNSSKFSIWPLLLSINELNYRTRRRHTLLGGLWFGKKKPNFDAFLTPFVVQAKDLASQGLTWTLKQRIVTSKIFFPLLSADSVAKCLLQGINQFNGEYSCPMCLVKGRSYKISERSHKWIFHPEEKAANRNHNLFIEHLNQLKTILEQGNKTSSHFGVKIASRLVCLPKFDMVKGFVFDYMHTALLGIARSLFFAWTDSKNHKAPYYIGNSMQEINERLGRCKVPAESQRNIRDTTDVKFWKANEWKNWILLAGAVLQGILPDCYLKHFSKFVDVISLLNQTCIREEDIIRAENLSRKFYKLLPELYDESYCSFNIHIFSHVAECVRNWGPLWGYSLFQFENFNGVLCNSFGGNNRVAEQISSKILCTQKAYTLSESEFSCTEAKHFYFSLIHNQHYFKKAKKCGNVTLIGAGKMYKFSDKEKKELTKLGLLQSQALAFKSCLISGKQYGTQNNSTRNRDNSIITVHENVLVIHSIIYLNNNVLFVCKKCITSELKNSTSIKIISIGKKVRLVNTEDLEISKFLSHFDTNGQLIGVTRLMNSVEIE